MYATMPTSRMPRRPKRSDKGPRDQLSSGQPDQAGSHGQLRDRGRCPEIGRERRQRREVQVHGDRPEDRQQEQEYRQHPAEAGTRE